MNYNEQNFIKRKENKEKNSEKFLHWSKRIWRKNDVIAHCTFKLAFTPAVTPVHRQD